MDKLDLQFIDTKIDQLAEAMVTGFETIQSTMNEGFEEAARERQEIRKDMRKGFEEAAIERERIRNELRKDIDQVAAQVAQNMKRFSPLETSAEETQERLVEVERRVA